MQEGGLSSQATISARSAGSSWSRRITSAHRERAFDGIVVQSGEDAMDASDIAVRAEQAFLQRDLF
jgi:hypothetical protein